MTVTFEDLPMDVLEKVVGESTLSDCLALRKVSPDLRNLVDSSEIHSESITLVFTKTHWLIVFENKEQSVDSLELNYENADNGGCLVTSNRIDTQKTKTYRVDRSFEKAMIADVSTFLANPKLKIDHMCLDRYEPAVEFFEFLKSLNFLLNVRSIESKYFEYFHSILPFLKPETLEEILFKNSIFTVAEFNKIVKSDASAILKNPKLKISVIHFEDYSNKSSATFFGILKSLDNQLRFGSIFISNDDERWISPVLRSLDPEKLEEITFCCVEFTIDQFNELAGKEQWRKRTELFNCRLPPSIRLDQLVGFKEFVSYKLEITDENLVTIRDIILKSPHFEKCSLTNFRDKISEHKMYKQLNRIFRHDPSYDVRTRRLSIPNSRDYFQFQLEVSDHLVFQDVTITIEKVSKR